MVGASGAGPDPVHYLPIATTAMAAAFLVVLWRRAMERGYPPHLLWWAVGVLFYGLGTALESLITLAGNSAWLTKLWYVAGAILGGYPLATGSVYFLCRRRAAHALTAVTLGLVVFAGAAVLLSPVDAARLEGHRPGGAALEWRWVRLLTPLINGYAALFLIGGAAYSSFAHFAGRRDPARAAGTGLIALGALLPGIGGGMAKAGIVEGLYVGEFAGLALIWAGYQVCLPSPVIGVSPTLTPALGGAAPPRS